MTTAIPTPQELQNIHDFAAHWGQIIARRACGEAGPARDAAFAALEQIAQTAAHGLLPGTLTTLLEQQARALPDTQPCPTCQKPGAVQREPRPLACLGATCTYHEPVCHGSACRRDFFPSADHAGPR